MSRNKGIAIPLALSCAALATVLFVPPVRDRFFTTKLWPWRTPWDVTAEQLEHMRRLAEPGDVIVESNLHGWQWMALCLVATGTTWVHAALVDENKRLLTVHKQVIEADWSIYADWGSTRMALLRPSYTNSQQPQIAIDFARDRLGTQYDPSFRDNVGNCNGLVASALQRAGLDIPTRNCIGRTVYPGDSFFRIPGVRVIYETNY